MPYQLLNFNDMLVTDLELDYEVLPTSNYLLINKWINYTIKKKCLSLITGQNGYGKSSASRDIAITSEGIKYFQVDVGEPPKIFYAKFLHELAENERLDITKLKTKYIHYLIERSSYIINDRNDISLIIIDEFGNFNRLYLPFLRQIWDNIHSTAGLVLVGPPSIELDLSKWQKESIPGINELLSRIGTNRVRLKETTHRDLKLICNDKGIYDSQFISNLYRTTRDLRIADDILEKKLEGIELVE
ncbi:MAG: ATP-binding protein [Ekhidna sp.]